MFRLHPALLVHTAQIAGRRRLVAQAWAGRPPLVLNSPVALAALNALPGEFDRRSAAEAWAQVGISEDGADGLWGELEDAGLLADAGPQPWWDTYGWREARAFHEATRDYPFLDMTAPDAMATDAARMDEYHDAEDGPPVFFQVRAESSVELRRLGEGESPDDRLEALSADARRGRDGLSLLLDVCFGARGHLRSTAGPCVLKSIPSGGARHPTEVYVAVFDVAGLSAGVYHYDVEHHALGRLYGGDHREAFAQATFDLFERGGAPPAAALVFTSRVERAMWRYREPRSARAILVDAGHAVMALRTVARKLGLRSYTLQEMRDSRVAELLLVDRLRQPPLYAATLVP